jgi:hypothetical protein
MGLENFKPIDKTVLRNFIRSVLKLANLWSPAAEDLLMGTCAQETRLGSDRMQIGGGPGRGIFSMELDTETDIWRNYLAFRTDLQRRIQEIAGVTGPGQLGCALEYNLAYQVLMARIQYLRFPDELPTDLEAMAALWKRRFNTASGKGTTEEFIQHFRELAA